MTGTTRVGYNTTVEYSDAITDTMLSALRQAVLLAGGAAFRSTDGMDDRFWSKVDRSDPDGCWPWTGAHDADGYGFFKVTEARGRYRQRKAPRVSLEMAIGRALGPQEMACHHCDNPPCVRPAHLYVGTVKTNAADAAQRGRVAHGSRNGTARLSEADVVAIRHRYAQGDIDQSVLAVHYGVSQATVSHLVLGRSWRRAGGPITRFGRNGRPRCAA